MRAFIDIVETYSYLNTSLLRYMKDGSFDPYRYWSDVCQFLWDYHEDELEEWFGRSFESFDDLHEQIDPDDFEKIPPIVRQEIEEHVYEHYMRNDPVDLPTHQHMSLRDDRLLTRSTWLVHFSDHAQEIAREGFTHGVDEMDRLGLTNYISDIEKKGGGYNFAFEALSRDAIYASRNGKYGKDAVVFQNAGVKCYHNGDEEYQIIFHGTSVDARNIFLLRHLEQGWSVMARHPKAKRDVLFTSSFEACVEWVAQHHDQYRGVL